MTMGYSAGELLEIAQQMERNGCAFYERAAEMAEGKTVGLLRQLADMERVHERTFATMATELSDEGASAAYDPNGEAAQYVRAVAGGRVFDLKANPVEWLGDGRTLSEILRKAIGLERDTIIYYLGVRDVLTGEARDRMDDVIGEEKSHVVLLTEQLKEAQG
jgi:rubrerythrin